MSEARTFELDGVRADGWFDRVLGSVPALERLCEGVGEPLVALSLVAGLRIVSAGIDRVSGEVSSLHWVRETGDGREVTESGPPDALRGAVMAALVSDAESTGAIPEGDDPAAVRAFLGPRYVLLAPLFGITLRRLTASPDEEARVLVKHEGGEETVPLRQLRRFLRARVLEVLQAMNRDRAVAIDLELVEVARAAHADGRFEDVVGRLGGWVGPLMAYLRTPEAAALDARMRGDLARALALLGDAFDRLGRAEEGEETLRLAVQYSHDGPAAAETYRVLARVLLRHERWGEAIGLIRRSLALEPEAKDLLPDLAFGYLETGRAVAALSCYRALRAAGSDDPRMATLERALRARFGEALARFEALVGEAR